MTLRMPHLGGSAQSDNVRKSEPPPPPTATYCIQEMLSSINTSMFVGSFGLAIHNLQLEAEFLVIWVGITANLTLLLGMIRFFGNRVFCEGSVDYWVLLTVVALLWLAQWTVIFLFYLDVYT